MKSLSVLIAALMFSQVAYAESAISLRADDTPVDKPWENGAALALSRSGGSSTALVDAVFKVKYFLDSAVPNGAQRTNASIGTYWHRDTDGDKPRNDRGFSLAYGGMRVPGFDPSGPVWSWGWMAQAKFGKTLKSTDTNGVRENFDLNSDRQILKGSFYYQPAISGIPHQDRGSMTSFYGADFGIYSDHVTGSGRATVDGRLAGVLGKVSANVAPLGLDPTVNRVGGGKLGFVPLLAISAQVQHDLNSTDGRLKETRRLYIASLTLQFAKPDDKGVPSIVISRSVGADLLVGQPKEAVTKVAFGLLF